MHVTEWNITIAFEPETSLPLLIRSYEDHPYFGPTTRDLQLYGYTEVDGLFFPQMQKIIYRGNVILEEIVVSQISVNPAFEPSFFDGLGEDETETIPSPPQEIPGYDRASLGEFWSNMLWSGL